MKKIIISSVGKDLDSKVDLRFGRASGFLLIDLNSMEFEHIDNSKVNEMGSGAGIQTAEMVAKLGVDAVLTGSIGPKARAVLDSAKISYLEGFKSITIREAIKKFKSE